MITPIDWANDISPAVVNPTTRTVVTDEDWIIAVTKAPVSAPMYRFEVSRAEDYSHPLAGDDLQALRHLFDAEQEQRKTAQQLYGHLPYSGRRQFITGSECRSGTYEADNQCRQACHKSSVRLA